ncbi:MAG: hypothetical protein HXM48_02790 [Leptotrichia sp.]|nr:hypothetical protein [Leptotrichia sp.]
MNSKNKKRLPILVTIFLVIFINKVWERSGPIAVLIVGVIILSIVLIGKKIFQKLKENSKSKGSVNNE